MVKQKQKKNDENHEMHVKLYKANQYGIKTINKSTHLYRVVSILHHPMGREICENCSVMYLINF